MPPKKNNSADPQRGWGRPKASFVIKGRQKRKQDLEKLFNRQDTPDPETPDPESTSGGGIQLTGDGARETQLANKDYRAKGWVQIASVNTENVPQWFDDQKNDYQPRGKRAESKIVSLTHFGHPGDSPYNIRARKFMARWSKEASQELRTRVIEEQHPVWRWQYFCAGVRDCPLAEEKVVPDTVEEDGEGSESGSDDSEEPEDEVEEHRSREKRCGSGVRLQAAFLANYGAQFELTADNLAQVKIWQWSEHDDVLPSQLPHLMISRILRLQIRDCFRDFWSQEEGIQKLYQHEIQWEERQVPASVDRDDDEAFIGRFVTHSACCASVNGTRQTFSTHLASPVDEHFEPLPRFGPPPPPPKKKMNVQPKSPFFCKACDEDEYPYEDEQVEDISDGSCCLSDEEPLEAVNKSNNPADKNVSLSSTDSDAPPMAPNMAVADYINSLNIEGRLSVQAHGKEILVAIVRKKTGTNFLIHVNFGLEGHCFCIPTDWYQIITSQPPVTRGQKSYAFRIPDEYLDGPVNGQVISIQAVFICPEWTLLFVDHNVLITFHLMRASGSFVPVDLQPGSSIWNSLWSKTHGPVYNLKPEETMEALDAWWLDVLDQPDDDLTPIFVSVKGTQTIFNGFGAQETTDLLLAALIHPQMPTTYVCRDDHVWGCFRQAVIDYDKHRMDLLLPSRLPYVSGPRPFCMNADGHRRYLACISTYRRTCHTAGSALFAAHKNSLFLPGAYIKPDGKALVPSGVVQCFPSAPTKLHEDCSQTRVRIPNYAITLPGGKKGIVTFIPFTAQPGLDWVKSKRETAGADVSTEVNKTTLALYSFRILVDCVWSTQKVAQIGGIPAGARPVLHAGSSHRKRPHAADIAKTAAPKKRRVEVVEKENTEPAGGIVPRSGRRLNR
ncbi:hypothetical protein B0H17DRAFT_1185359 [Mycena rosella]|uniref:Uncharacterized protein n=1 Tax=Mycena rosella TaxID=1033263 RepID=A0AAD7G6C7_MYCRO|nr:hypothetical protein B0H17DRAFT_1185359 [Mycena rosella]